MFSQFSVSFLPAVGPLLVRLRCISSVKMGSKTDCPSQMCLPERLWEDSRKEFKLDSCIKIPFVELLREGKLLERVFTHYECQDAEYLRGYLGCHGALLLKLNPKSATFSEDSRIVKGSMENLLKETDMVTKNTRAESAPLGSVPAFDDYIEFMTKHALQPKSSDGKSNALALCTSLTPCARLYAEIGKALKESGQMGSLPVPFQAWIDTYSSAAFSSAAAKSDLLLQHLWEDSDDTSESAYLEMYGVYREAMDLELKIFDFYSRASADSSLRNDF